MSEASSHASGTSSRLCSPFHMWIMFRPPDGHVLERETNGIDEFEGLSLLGMLPTEGKSTW